MLAAVLLTAPSLGEARPPVIAVFNVEAQDTKVRKKTLAALSEFLATTVAATGEYQVVPREQLQKRLRQQKVSSYKQCYDASCQIEIGKELAAEQAMATRIVRIGRSCVVNLKVFDLRSAATSFGKGSVQVLHDLPAASMLKMSVAQYVLAGDYRFSLIGLTPDVRLEKPTQAQKGEDPVVELARQVLLATPGTSRREAIPAIRTRFGSNPLVERIEAAP